MAVIPKLGITNFKAIHHRDKLADYLSHKMLVCATPHTHLMSVRRLSKNIQAEVLNGWSSFHLGYVLWNALLFRCCTLFQRNVIYPVENEKYLLPHADDQMKEKKIALSFKELSGSKFQSRVEIYIHSQAPNRYVVTVAAVVVYEFVCFLWF